jgi:hypothetical protein
LADSFCDTLARFENWNSARVKNNYELLLRFLSIDEETRGYALKVGKILYPHLDGIIDRFYANAMTNNVNAHINLDIVRHLRIEQKNHWVHLFATAMNESYFSGVRRIIERHKAINLDPMWYVAGYFNFKIEFTSVVVRSKLSRAELGHMLLALEKYVAVDMSLTMSNADLEFID